MDRHAPTELTDPDETHPHSRLASPVLLPVVVAFTRFRGSMPSPCFPPTVCDKVPSFPFTGSRGKVRPLHWYYEDTPTSAVRLAGSLRSPGNTCAAPCPSLPPVQGRTSGEPGAFLFGATVPNRMETQ